MRLHSPKTVWLLAACFLLPVGSDAAAPWIHGKLPMVASPLDSALSRTWTGLKKRNIQPWTDGLVHRPKSEAPGDAVSEGQAYGMILALYENDQTVFNSVWDAAESKMWNEGAKAYDWRYQDGKITGSGMAPDADEDIALMLIFADALVSKGIWTAHSSPKGVDYKSRAQIIVNSIWNTAINASNHALRPAPNWGGGGTCTNGKDNWPCGEHVNPGYFSPASFRIFQQFDPSKNWSQVVDASYQILAKSPGYSKGLLPDWMNVDGSEVSSSALGYNPFFVGRAFYKDAIRIHWRLAMDYLWFQEPRAKTFLDNAFSFVKGDPSKANFYKMDGSLVPVESTFTLSGSKGPSRSRREHSHLTVGQWACAAMVSGGADSVDTWAKQLLKFYTPGADFWGNARDPLGGVEDTAHNEVYFDQFLAWFGASVLAGRFTNVLADLNASDAATKQGWKTPMAITGSLSPSKTSLQFSGELTKPAAWAVRVVHLSKGTEWTSTGVGSSLSFAWNGLAKNGQAFPAGDVSVSVRVRGLTDTTTTFTLSDAIHAKTRRSGFAVASVPGGLSIDAPEACQLRVRDLQGRVLVAANLQTGSVHVDVPGQGLVMVETRSQSGFGADKVLLRP